MENYICKILKKIIKDLLQHAESQTYKYSSFIICAAHLVNHLPAQIIIKCEIRFTKCAAQVINSGIFLGL